MPMVYWLRSTGAFCSGENAASCCSGQVDTVDEGVAEPAYEFEPLEVLVERIIIPVGHLGVQAFTLLVIADKWLGILVAVAVLEAKVPVPAVVVEVGLPDAVVRPRLRAVGRVDKFRDSEIDAPGRHPERKPPAVGHRVVDVRRGPDQTSIVSPSGHASGTGNSQAIRSEGRVRHLDRAPEEILGPAELEARDGQSVRDDLPHSQGDVG